MTRTIIDVHVLQTVPPSNLNRDDTGSPKTAVYGGTRRSRVSSQSWKRATRTAFADLLDPSQLGVRTLRVSELLAGAITEADDAITGEQASALADTVLSSAGFKVAKKNKGDEYSESGFLLFLSRLQIEHLARLAVASAHSGVEIDKKAARAAADSQHSVDLALFGRMVADAPDLNVDASAQVAHAISVHAVNNEYDYFTAVDDRRLEDSAGAGMIGTVEFNSSTLYRYATVNADALATSLGSAEATSAAVSAFLTAFITSMPTGKQNTFANRTLPEAVVVTIRKKQSVNLVGAFEEAVVATDSSGRLKTASERLAEYAQEIDRAYSTEPVASYVVRVGAATKPLEALGQSVSLDDLTGAVASVVNERIGVPA
ncbi:type I-E CRISPR-associated protein Cas7/Cse4/CasC [Okibacterium endophyticum]